ncbi:MAG: tRNA glutamyl-Q(34) synthetase GluQRS [Acidobacteriota bacterium]
MQAVSEPPPVTDETAPAHPRGRWAPTPSGLLHLGCARTALVAWLSVRSAGGRFIWRVEDLDPPREVAGAAGAALDDLGWLGLDWDEGPDVGGPHAPYEQSSRADLYHAALQRLADADRLFPCRRSRRELRELARAPHGPYGPRTPPYPRRWRPARLAADWFARYAESHEAALRFRVADEVVRFDDRLLGRQRQDVAATVGDFVLHRRDGLFAYQLAVVVDDLAMAIDEVVRGVDLLDSTGRQIQLLEALGGARPRYAHVPLLLDADGEKLSKRHDALTLRSLREQGVRPEQIVGLLAHGLGLRNTAAPVDARALIDDFAWSRIPRDDVRLGRDLFTAS